MNVLVVGGSGFIGTHLSAELVDRGHDVTVLSRDPEGEELPADVDTVMGDVTAYDSIEGAFEGQDAVVFLVALSPLFKPKGGNDRHFEVHTEGTRNVVQAAEDHGVEHIVHMSALGADADGPTAYLKSKGQAEQVVTGSALDYVVFRPSVVFGEGGEFVSFTKRLKGMFAPGLPLYPLPGGGTETRFQPIWVGDLVPMLADAIEDEDGEHADETYEIGGPEVLTLREITEMVYDAEGKSVKIVGLPMGLAGVGLKTLGALPGFPMGGDQYRSLRIDNTTTRNDIESFGVEASELTTLGDYLGTTA
jgi:NADH dehydrogenase